eukprot:SAG31_NODE_36095_length_316_cov_1.184332_1_plen_28_part_01
MASGRFVAGASGIAFAIRNIVWSEVVLW